MNFKILRNSWFSNLRGDILSGMTVALALIPEAISFAIICGVDPMVGLYASFCIAITISIVGGRPGMISAATGAMALVMVTLVKQYGLEYMFAATILTGVIQFIMGRLKIGKLISFVPHPVILGFVNSLAILIFMAQIPHFKGQSLIMYLLVAATLAIIYLLPRLTKKVPSALIAIVVMTGITVVLKLEVFTVGDMGNITRTLPVFHLPVIPLTIETLKIILPYSISLALVGMMESLLTATIVDEMTDTKSNKSKEVSGQGIANIVCGLFGGMAGCAMIGQSVINVKSGGRKRLSTFVAGLFLIFLIMVLGDFVKIIPMAALVGVMIMVSISTFEWSSIKEVRKMPVSCAIVMITTMVTVIATDNLAIGVIVGTIVNSISFAWQITLVNVKEHHMKFEGNDVKIYRVHGQVFFASISKLLEQFDYANGPKEVIIDFKNSHIWDYSGVNGMTKIKEKYEQNGRKVSFVGFNEKSSILVKKANERIFEY